LAFQGALVFLARRRAAVPFRRPDKTADLRAAPAGLNKIAAGAGVNGVCIAAETALATVFAAFTYA
jgi:hypothetical protein